jgi:hypothetical protein
MEAHKLLADQLLQTGAVYRRQTDCGAWADVAPSLALFTNRPNFLIFLFSPPYILFLEYFFTKSESTTLI